LSGKTVYEVGPGPGGLTRALLEAGANVVAVETDTRCLAALAEIGGFFPDKLTVIQENALKIDELALFPGGASVVANLPYNISTTLLAKWLTNDRFPFADLTLMFQKEVADRILAGPGSKTYGRISVLAQWRCKIQRAFDVPRQAFVPPPKVESTIIHLTPHSEPAAVNPRELEKVTAAAFGQRRKMLRSSLKGVVESPVAVLEELDIDPTKRAEDLSVAQFCALTVLIARGSSV
jgi:16S rRNA (adenine1518-N6/adenine1519-N6)-dimethyltransferase